MTPNDIEILIHYCTSPSVHERLDAPAVKDSIASMVDCGLLEPIDNNGMYIGTERGWAHLEQICQLNLPRRAWLGDNGKVIDLS